MSTPALPENLDDAFAWFEARTNLEKGIPPGGANRVYRLDRMRMLCDAFGNPQDAVPSIHIAGSKGKGSTAAYCAALATSIGRRTGVYASPHLVDYRERFRIEGQAFPEAVALDTARDLIGRLPFLEDALPGDSGATTFELLTLFAFLLFRNTGCDLMVLETGLGGRLDATNVVSRPLAVILTPIEKEHTEILGRRLPQIASEKAGIIKPGVPVFSAGQKAPVKRVFRKRAGTRSASLNFADRFVSRISSAGNDNDWVLSWKDGKQENLHLAMAGRYQAENAVLALATIRRISEIDVESGVLGTVGLPGRSQYLQTAPPVMIDGAHTPRSVQGAAGSFLRHSGPDPVLIFGSVLEKDCRGMARILCGGRQARFRTVIISTPGTFKPSDPVGVAAVFRRIGRRTGVDVTLLPDPGDAWRAAREAAGDTRGILVTGSFYMAGEIARLAINLNNNR